MKKKKYVAPSMEIEEMEGELQLLAGSAVSADGIEFGGFDYEGELDPS